MSNSTLLRYQRQSSTWSTCWLSVFLGVEALKAVASAGISGAFDLPSAGIKADPIYAVSVVGMPVLCFLQCCASRQGFILEHIVNAGIEVHNVDERPSFAKGAQTKIAPAPMPLVTLRPMNYQPYVKSSTGNYEAMYALGLDPYRTIEAQLSEEELTPLKHYMTGIMLDPREVAQRLPIWRAIQQFISRMPGLVGVEISAGWDGLRSKMCVDAGHAKVMYVIVPVPRRAAECRAEISQYTEYASKVKVVDGYATEVVLPKKVKADFILFEPADPRVGLLPEDQVVLADAKRRFLRDQTMKTSFVIIV